MHKLVILVETPEDEDAFNDEWPLFLFLAERMPGLRRESTSRVDTMLYGSLSYSLIHELYFDSLEALKAAMKSQEGRLAGSQIQKMTRGRVALLVAEHQEDSLEHIQQFNASAAAAGAVPPETGAEDTESTGAAPPETGVEDAGPAGADSSEAGASETGSEDTVQPDAGIAPASAGAQTSATPGPASVDAASVDAASVDAASVDAASVDATNVTPGADTAPTSPPEKPTQETEPPDEPPAEEEPDDNADRPG